jgi:hypothetical protein
MAWFCPQLARQRRLRPFSRFLVGWRVSSDKLEVAGAALAALVLLWLIFKVDLGSFSVGDGGSLPEQVSAVLSAVDDSMEASEKRKREACDVEGHLDWQRCVRSMMADCNGR